MPKKPELKLNITEEGIENGPSLWLPLLFVIAAIVLLEFVQPSVSADVSVEAEAMMCVAPEN